MSFLRRLLGLVARRRLDADLAEEIGWHVEERARRLEEDGLTPAAARRLAERELGGQLRTRERARDEWRIALWDDLGQDVRYALRLLRRTPAFTLAAVCTLATGIGATTAIYSVVDTVLLRPLPFEAAERLVVVDGAIGMPGAYALLAADSRALEFAAIDVREEHNLTGRGLARRIDGAAVSANFFSLLGIEARHGRTFGAGEDGPGRPARVLLSHRFWRELFGDDAGAVGRSLLVDGRPHEIVGILPPDLRVPGSDALVWLPLELDPAQVGAFWGSATLTLVGRLRDDVTLAAADAELRTHVPRIRERFPWRMADAWGSDARLRSWHEALAGPVRQRLLVLLGTALFVLLAACANVANLLLTRGAARHRELTVRAALGAGRRRLLRQLVTESLVLAALGAGLGVLLARLGVPLLVGLLPAETPRLADIAVDLRVLTFAGLITLVTALLFGVLPALRAARQHHGRTSTEHWRTATAGRADRHLAAGLVAVEVALAVVLAVGAALLARSLWQLSRVDTGFALDRLISARITPNGSVCPTPERCLGFYADVLERVRARPDVASAALTNALPMGDGPSAFAAHIEDHPRDDREGAFMLWSSTIDARYLETLRLPLLRGRGFTSADRPGTDPVALISASMARRFWPDRDPIGRRIKPVWQREWRTIVGIVGDVREGGLAGRPDWVDGSVYLPFAQGGVMGMPPTEMSLVVRAAGSGTALLRDLPGIVREVSPDAPVSRLRPFEQVVAATIAAPRSTAGLVGGFAIVGVLLGAIGIAGVVAYTVTQRTREIAIRVALGSTSNGVLRAVLSQTLAWCAAGLAAGLTLATVLAGLLERLLFATLPRDPVGLAVAAALVAVVASAAAYLPARRALSISPSDALRAD